MEYCLLVDSPANGSSPFQTRTPGGNRLFWGEREGQQQQATSKSTGALGIGETSRRVGRARICSRRRIHPRAADRPLRVTSRIGRLCSLQSRLTRHGHRGKPPGFDSIDWIDGRLIYKA